MKIEIITTKTFDKGENQVIEDENIMAIRIEGFSIRIDKDETGCLYISSPHHDVVVKPRAANQIKVAQENYPNL